MSNRAVVWWGLAFWLAILFTPAIRVAGIPLRLDDLIIFGTGAFLVAASVLENRVPRLGALGLALVVMMVYMIGDTLRGSPVPGLSVGPKEYLDFLRPLKFLIVLLVAQRAAPGKILRTMYWLLPAAVTSIVLLAVAQLIVLRPDSTNILAAYSLSFSAMPVDDFRRFFGYRPFATFSTPADLGYVMSVFLILAAIDGGVRSRQLVLGCAVIGLVLSGTRTFLFSLPVILGVTLMLSARDSRRALRLFGVGIVLSLAIGWALFQGVTSASQEAAGTARALLRGEVEQEASITGRLQNLSLVMTTWEDAPITGVVSRDLIDPELVGGVDSEYVMTFHRYGLVGISLLLWVYAAAVMEVRRYRTRYPNTAQALLVVVLVTAVYGVTQGAIINTRLGTILFYLVGSLRGQVSTVAAGPSSILERVSAPGSRSVARPRVSA